MIKKLFTKYILEVIPSIVATVVGAYIVTHYINAKTDADKPKTEAAAPADTSKAVAPQTLKSDDTSAKADAAKADAAKARADKLAADKAAAERIASERAEAAAKKAAADKLASEKAASEKREKTAVKSAPVVPAAAEANAVADDKRDANDMARAAIERLRSAEPKNEAKVEEPARVQEKARVNSVVYAPAAAPQPPIQPLPPAVTVAPQPSEINVSQPRQAETRADESFRPTPPASIPSRPLDIRVHERERSVGESVVSAAKSVFQAVIPDSSN